MSINWEYGGVNHENGRQNYRHVTENCAGVTMKYAHKAENNGSHPYESK